MATSQTNRIWWDDTQPGRSADNLSDATPSAATPASENEETGIEGRHSGRLFVCERSGFTVPYAETVIDPVTGRRVWFRFADDPAPTPDDRPQIPPSGEPPWES